MIVCVFLSALCMPNLRLLYSTFCFFRTVVCGIASLQSDSTQLPYIRNSNLTMTEVSFRIRKGYSVHYSNHLSGHIPLRAECMSSQ
jgi:hypothetical protein